MIVDTQSNTRSWCCTRPGDFGDVPFIDQCGETHIGTIEPVAQPAQNDIDDEPVAQPAQIDIDDSDNEIESDCCAESDDEGIIKSDCGAESDDEGIIEPAICVEPAIGAEHDAEQGVAMDEDRFDYPQKCLVQPHHPKPTHCPTTPYC